MPTTNTPMTNIQPGSLCCAAALLLLLPAAIAVRAAQPATS